MEDRMPHFWLRHPRFYGQNFNPSLLVSWEWHPLHPRQCLFLEHEILQTSFRIKDFDWAHFPEFGPGLFFQLQNMNQLMILKNKTSDISLYLEKEINILCSALLIHSRIIFTLTQWGSNWISSEREENISPTLPKKKKKFSKFQGQELLQMFPFFWREFVLTSLLRDLVYMSWAYFPFAN